MNVIKKILQIAQREWHLIVSDSRLRSVVLVAPFVYAGLMAAVYSKHQVSDVAMVIYNQDQGSLSRQLVRMFEGSAKLKVVESVSSMESIQKGLTSDEFSAAVVIPENFTERLKTGHDSQVTVFVNAAHMVLANTAASQINRVVGTLSAGIEVRALMKYGVPKKRAGEVFMPIKVDMRPMFNPTFNYTNFMIPGILMTILQQVILMGIALSLTGEKERNSLKELWQISSNPLVILAGKGSVYWLINFAVAEFYLRILFPYHDIPIVGNWHLTIWFTGLFIAVVVTWGMWVSALCKTRLFATQLLMFLAMPSFVLSGFTWPLEAMPSWVQLISKTLPMTHFVTNFRQIYLAGSKFSDVWPSWGILGLFLVVNILAFWVIAQVQGAQRDEGVSS